MNRRFRHLHFILALALAIGLSPRQIDAQGKSPKKNRPPVATEPVTSTPYTGTAISLPGMVQAENFDNGGAGVAYGDTSSGNSGGQYRQTDVDIEATTDGGSGHNVGWLAAGEWLVYTVSVPTAGSYRLNVRVASSDAGGRLHVEFDGVDKTGAMTIPHTGGWQTWTTISAPVTLAAGTQKMRVAIDAASSAGMVGNINHIEVVTAVIVEQASAPEPSPTPAPTPTPTPTPTPAPLVVPTLVTEASQLQPALNAAAPGDVIEIQRGAVLMGNFLLPPKAGAVTLVGCAELRSPNNMPVIATMSNGDNWVIRGAAADCLLRLSSASPLGDLMRLGTATQALADVPQYHRVQWVHFKGDPVNGQKRGLALNSYEAVITQNAFTDIKSGTQDTQCILMWNGPGKYTITDNYCEATGENIMIGGADPSIYGLIPADIVIERNRLVKPLSWRTTTFNSGVKNNFELKVGQRVKFRYNTIDGNWVAGQTGYAVVIKSTNQDGKQTWAETSDVEIAYNTAVNISAFANVAGKPEPNPAVPAHDVYIHHNTVTTDSKTLGGAGRCLVMQAVANVRFEYNSCFIDGASAIYFTEAGVNNGMTIIGNILPDHTWGIKGSGSGEGVAALTTWAPGAVFTANLIVTNSPWLYGSSSVNYLVATMPSDTTGYGATTP